LWAGAVFSCASRRLHSVGPSCRRCLSGTKSVTVASAVTVSVTVAVSVTVCNATSRWRGQALAPSSQGGSINSLCCSPLVHAPTVATLAFSSTSPSIERHSRLLSLPL
jgi:hypothetical protein